MVIKVLGSGCANCKKLYDNVNEALKESNIEAEVVKVEDMMEILSYGVMKTPALVVDDEVKVSGKVAKVKEIIKAIG